MHVNIQESFRRVITTSIGGSHSKRISRDLRRLQTGNRFEVTGNREAWQLIKSITITDAISAPALQVADLLAWSTIRQRTNHQGVFLMGIAVAVKKIIRSSWTHINDSNAVEWCANVPR